MLQFVRKLVDALAGYESKWAVDLYVEHHGYDPMDYKNSNPRDYKSSDSSDAYCSSFINEPIPDNEDLHIEDLDSSSLEPRHQIQRGIAYPRHDPLQPWNEMQPILGMRYDHSEQLKLALANYGVAGGYQLWFQKNDWRELLVYCGRDVSTGRCAGCKVGEGISKDGEGSSRNSDVSPKWTKSKIASSRKSGQPCDDFRFWTVIPSGFQELKVRHAYLFLNKEPNEGVDHWYSQEKWFEAYQFSIKPIYGSNMWKKQPNKPLLPPIVIRMPGRPRKNKVKAKTENNLQASGVLGEASGVVGEASGGIGQSNATRFQANTKRGESSGRRGRARGRGGRSGRARGRGARGQGRGGRGRERSVTTMLVDEEEMNEEEIRKNMEHEYMKQILIEEEEERIAAEKAIQEELDKRLKVDT
ncbi:hypothetical protein Tco_0771820 [Tanacetum coccineum]|uniref:Uncharacterized protein n=1 Tax=Tanacetum coccineum TaxID=301880 RepID=A0ABQ4ZG76_9ASTR